MDRSDVACCAVARPLNLCTRYLGPMPVQLFFLSAPRKTNVISHKPSVLGGRRKDFSNECGQVEYGGRLACEGNSKSQKDVGVDR